MRLRKIAAEFGPALVVESRAFPLRSTPEAAVPFKGTYREEGWRRCAAMSAGDGIRFTPWPHDRLPGWSIPALEAAKCLALQGPALFDRLHLRLYAAFFEESRDIADPDEIRALVEATGADMERFAADTASGKGRAVVAADYEAAISEHGVRGIPHVVIEPTGETLVGLAELHTYRAAVRAALG